MANRTTPHRLVIKVFGERNSGTNFAEQVLRSADGVKVLPQSAPRSVRRVASHLGPLKEQTLDLYDTLARHRTMGWKHCYLDEKTADRLRRKQIVGLAVTKHPLSWLVSLRRSPYHMLKTDDGVAHQRLVRERLPYEPKNVLDVWQIKTQRYLDLHDAGGLLFTRFEDTVLDPAEVLQRVFASAGHELGELVVPQRNVKKHQDSRSTEQIRTEYAAEKWRANLTERDYDMARETLSPQLLQRLDYTI